MTRFTLLAAAAVTTLAAGAALADTAIQTVETAAGAVLANGEGMTLYTFDKDMPAVSNCYEGCAVNWPPMMASAQARPTGEFGIILRADGSRQWTYRGMPLYTWIKDAAQGDITGDGVKGVWHIAQP